MESFSRDDPWTNNVFGGNLSNPIFNMGSPAYPRASNVQRPAYPRASNVERPAYPRASNVQSPAYPRASNVERLTPSKEQTDNLTTSDKSKEEGFGWKKVMGIAGAALSIVCLLASGTDGFPTQEDIEKDQRRRRQ